MSIDMYEHMLRPDAPFEAYLLHDQPGGTHLAKYCKEFLPSAPDYILGGMGCDLNTFADYQNRDYIVANKIKTIFQIGDHSQFIDAPAYRQMNSVCAWDLLWNVSVGQNIPVNQRLDRFVKTWRHFKDTQIMHHTWAYDPTRHTDPGEKEKEFDVFFSMTVDGMWFNAMRGKMYNSLIPLQKECVIRMGQLDQNMKWHGMYGDQYAETLKKSKICLVDTSLRHYMTAKYLEAAASGCLLMGDAPWGMEDTFNDETMVILDYNNLEQDLTDKIRYYLAHPGERIEKVKHMSEKMNQFQIPNSVPVLEQKILDILPFVGPRA